MSKYNSCAIKKTIVEIINKKGAKVHFSGVGGVGMYSLIKLTRERGCIVSGSDREPSRLTDALSGSGIDVKIGHKAENAKCDLLVYTLALDGDNPELVYARENSIPTVSRAEYMGALMEEYGERLCVSGTHGKTTTTAMLDSIFHLYGSKPTTLLGANIPICAEPLRIGKKDVFICEACEYKDSFLRLCPTASVFTSLELDHVDYFDSMESIKKSFLTAMNLPTLCVVNYDDENLRTLITKTKNRCVSFGTSPQADYKVTVTGKNAGCYSFRISHVCRDDIEISLKIPGRFNVMNAAAAAALSFECGVPGGCIQKALSAFPGVERRMEKLCTYKGADVYYDYAHHPTEIKCTLEAVKEICGGRVAVIFKPHTYSRTLKLFDKFVATLSQIDNIILYKTYPAREDLIEGGTAEDLFNAISSSDKLYFDNVEDLFDYIKNTESGYDCVLVLGAGDLAEKLKIKYHNYINYC